MNKNNNILIVDDDSFITKMLVNALSDNFDLTVCHDAIEGLKYIESNSYAAVITDLNMPIKDGLDFAREIKAINSNTPVLMISGESFDKQKDFSYLNKICMYADDTLGKPFTKDELISSLNSIIN